jgi:hypothetical protein
MLDTPNYGFYKHPRFSVNHLAEYLSTINARQRETVIRAAKFPRKTTVVPYTQGKRSICDFMASNGGDVSYFEEALRRLESRRQREAEGWMRDELGRNIEAIEAFKRVFVRRRLRRYSFTIGPTDLTMSLEGVRINTRLDVGLTETGADDVTYSGGCVMFIAKGDQSRRNITERQKAVASMIQWELENSNPNIETLPRLCISLDVFGGEIVKAAIARDRFRNDVESACREAASRWDGVAPPAGYDGPNWR